MPRKKAPTKPYTPKLGYGFADLLVLTDASKSNLIHWTNIGIVKAGIEDTYGRGYQRRFSPLNVIEVQLATAVNKFRVPVETIREALDTFRSFHRKAVALYEVFARAPLVTEPAHLALFPTVEHRLNVANGYVNSLNIVINNEQLAVEKGRALGEAWHHVRTGSYSSGAGESSWRHFLGLFIAKEADSNHQDIAGVWLDPSPEDLGDAVGRSAIVVDLVDAVFRVGQHCKHLGGFPLGSW